MNSIEGGNSSSIQLSIEIINILTQAMLTTAEIKTNSWIG